MISRARTANRVGFGKRPAILVIDAQNYMLGDKEEPILESTKRFSSSCGDVGWKAMRKLREVLEVAREKKVPIFYTTAVFEPDGRDMGVKKLKRRGEIRYTENGQFTGTFGSRIAELVAPQEGDIVLVKKKLSAFFGTPLNSYLNFLGIDTVLIAGGSTSNCVRATYLDAASLNYRTTIIEDCVFDRIQICHDISLFDMCRNYADVVLSDEIIQYLKSLHD